MYPRYINAGTSILKSSPKRFSRSRPSRVFAPMLFFSRRILICCSYLATQVGLYSLDSIFGRLQPHHLPLFQALYFSPPNRVESFHSPFSRLCAFPRTEKVSLRVRELLDSPMNFLSRGDLETEMPFHFVEYVMRFFHSSLKIYAMCMLNKELSTERKNFI